MNKKYFIALLFVGFLSAQSQIKTTGLVPLGDGTMTVQIDLNNTISQVKVTLSGPSLRWFSIGLDCDLMFGQHDCMLYTDGLHDAQMTGAHTAPVLDAIENWTLLSDQIVSGTRTIEAVRNFDSGDPTDFSFYSSLTSLNIIWAYASLDTSVLFHHADNFGIATLYFNDLGIPITINNSSKLVVFKKPNSNTICIANSTGYKIQEVTIYSIRAQMLKKYKIEQTNILKIELPIDEFQNGTYIIETLFTNEKKVFNQIVL
jgi:hypothetical protein